MADNLQVLREIDKLDKIGLDGVCKMLGDGMTDSSGAFNKGAGLNKIQVGMIRHFFEPLPYESDNLAKLSEMRKRLDHISKIRTRVDLMVHLDSIQSGAETKWDDLLNMHQNADETWRDDGRPANIAFALDDIVEVLRQESERLEETK